MESVKELIKTYGLQEDIEYVIIPMPDKDGKQRRCFILKRDFIRVVYPDGQYIDYPLADVIEALVRFPDLLLSEALSLTYKERGIDPQQLKVSSESLDKNSR
ncbi:MAG: hypothetical protein N3A59_07920 [Thermodesulfovibrionales bacterium]|nr:hypothetical protein [Thermodesulfovibrionales bacterium]